MLVDQKYGNNNNYNAFNSILTLESLSPADEDLDLCTSDVCFTFLIFRPQDFTPDGIKI